MTDATLAASKTGLRALAHERRAALDTNVRAKAATVAAALFFAEVDPGPGTVVACYWPIGDELDCRPVLSLLMDEGRTVCLPVVTAKQRPLQMRVWEPGTALEPAGFGTFVPQSGAPLAVPDLFLMPLLGFDGRGTRLGYGGGYYDRTVAVLAGTAKLAGFCFAAQEFDAVPRESHDVPLDMVITEAGVRHFDKVSM